MSYNSPFTGNVVQPTDVSYRAVTLSANTQLQWPINGNATDDYAARIMEVTATTSGLSLLMPPANQASVGEDAMIRNVGANSFTVRTFGSAGSIVTVAAGEAKYIYITSNANTSGTWGIIGFGAGTSSADAATLAGYGLLASGLTLNAAHPAANIVNAGTFSDLDRAQTRIWTGGAGTYSLPIASTLGNNWFTLFKNNGTGSIVISCDGVQTIDGNTTKTFAPTESAIIVCTGTEYITVGYGVSSTFAFTAFIKNVTGGSYTLSASEAANTIQTYVGTLVNNVTVVYPPVVNFYVISNQTVAGGYSLTVGTGSGASVVIPSGNQVSLICDGTNFFNANTTQAGSISTFSAADGNVGAPSFNFANETDTGFYRPSPGNLGVAVEGVQIVDVSGTGVAVTGTGNFSNGISGGSF